MSQQKTTTNHTEIKNWAQEHNGVPAVIKDTEEGSGAGVLRIHFDNSDDSNFKQVSWSEFFDTFDKKDLAFLYQDEKDSTFHKFINKKEA